MPLKLSELKVGDRVVLISSRWSRNRTNPVWDGPEGKVSGKVTDIEAGHYARVSWDNGTANTYVNDDLDYEATVLKPAAPTSAPTVTVTPTATTSTPRSWASTPSGDAVATPPVPAPAPKPLATVSISIVAPQTFVSAVQSQVQSFIRDGLTFSAYDITQKIRKLVNEKTLRFSDRADETVDGLVTQRVVHSEVRNIVSQYVSGSPTYTKRLSASGDYIEYTPLVPTSSKPSVTVTPTAIVQSGTLAPQTSISAEVVKITSNYIKVKRSATLKQIQSRIKKNSPTVRELENVAKGLGFTIIPATPYYKTIVSA